MQELFDSNFFENTVKNKDLENYSFAKYEEVGEMLAENRRNYTVQQEFVYLVYNDMLKHFVESWNGKCIKHKTYLQENINSSYDFNNEKEILEIKKAEKAEQHFEKLVIPDEIAQVLFVNKNLYHGSISRKMMEGEGLYKWHSGTYYKGEFEMNRIQGKGYLEWNYGAWYEGDFLNGYRHGEGIMVDRDFHRLYIGQWHLGQKHGRGFCSYCLDFERNSYDGDWVSGKRDGVGTRIYPGSAKYIGKWENDFRHGFGVMTWSNGDVYRGEWQNGKMHGKGEYVWNGFFNKTLCWPQENSYIGEWQNGQRHGRGILRVNSIGGARYCGMWINDKKYGYGVIIGNNGALTNGDCLFLENMITSKQSTQLIDSEESDMKQKINILPKVTKCRETTILKPEQCPDLRYHVHRFLQARQFSQNFTTKPTGELDEFLETEGDIIIEKLYNCIITYISKLRQIFNIYAAMYCPENIFPACNLSMSRLSLWQLWRDCGIHRKFSLIDIDKYLVLNKSILMESSHYPFERIEIWQFLHALLEVAWHLYVKREVTLQQNEEQLIDGFRKLLLHDIFPNAGKKIGNFTKIGRDLLPLYAIYELYQSIGEPFSVRKLLQHVYNNGNKNIKGLHSSTFKSQLNVSINLRRFINGINIVSIGERISFLPNEQISNPLKYDENSAYDLTILQKLSAKQLFEVISNVCPSIKDAETKIIVNMEYELTFLEFYEILLEATIIILQKEKLATSSIFYNEVSGSKMHTTQHELQK